MYTLNKIQIVYVLMIRKSYRYINNGWNDSLDESLDSTQTLIIIFGPSELAKLHVPLEEIYRLFPNSTLIGASGSGQIFGTEIKSSGLLCLQ